MGTKRVCWHRASVRIQLIWVRVHLVWSWLYEAIVSLLVSACSMLCTGVAIVVIVARVVLLVAVWLSTNVLLVRVLLLLETLGRVLAVPAMPAIVRSVLASVSYIGLWSKVLLSVIWA